MSRTSPSRESLLGDRCDVDCSLQTRFSAGYLAENVERFRVHFPSMTAQQSLVNTFTAVIRSSIQAYSSTSTDLSLIATGTAAEFHTPSQCRTIFRF